MSHVSCVGHTIQFAFVFHGFWALTSCSQSWQRLTKQLEDLDVPFTEDFPAAIKSTDHIVDAIFGASFKVS